MGGAPGGFGGVTTEKCSPGRVWSGELAVWGTLRGGIEGDGAQPRPPQAGAARGPPRVGEGPHRRHPGGG